MKVKNFKVEFNAKKNLYQVVGFVKMKITLKQGYEVLGVQKDKKKIVFMENKDFLVCEMFRYIINYKNEYSKILE